MIEFRDVSLRYDGDHRERLSHVDFTVPEGGVTALLGRNGVGKTTTLKAILGIVPATGNIEFDGHRIDEAPTHRIVRSGVGYVPEDRDVFASLTVEENLRLAEVPGVQPDYETVHDLFPELRDRRKQRAGTLSGGQQQMVAGIVAIGIVDELELFQVDVADGHAAPLLRSNGLQQHGHSHRLVFEAIVVKMNQRRIGAAVGKRSPLERQGVETGNELAALS